MRAIKRGKKKTKGIITGAPSGFVISLMVHAAAFMLAGLLVVLLGMVAFSIGTAAGLLMGKVMYRVTGKAVNPLIGAAGVSAVPMAARVANKIGLQANPQNFLLMHAMGNFTN